MHADGGGLWLQVTKASGERLNRSWLFRYATGETRVSKAGKKRQHERLMGLGALENVSLAEAREKAAEYRKLREEGVDPILARDSRLAAQRGANARAMTFDQCRDAYLAAHGAKWRNAKHAAQWPSTLRLYASSVIGGVPVAAIDTPLVMKVLEPIWSSKPETANRVRGRIEAVLDWAKAGGFRDGDNPARWKGHLSHLLPSRSKVKAVRHHPALPYAAMKGFMSELRTKDGISALALQFTILTVARTGEVIGARRTEIDTDRMIWTIPGERMKSAKEHRVPLSKPAAEIIDACLDEQNDYIFRNARGHPLSNMAMLELVRRFENWGSLTTHGFRSTFRDWAAEQTNFPNHVVEMALAHAVGDKVEAAYRRGELLEKRRELMAAWAAFCGYPAGAAPQR